MMHGTEAAAFITLIVTAGVTITRVANAFFNRGAARMPARDATRDSELEQRLARIEHAVESIAVEVERISEGQRFTTKLLAERPMEAMSYARAGADHAR
jgi:hypothetical protein